MLDLETTVPLRNVDSNPRPEEPTRSRVSRVQ